MKLSHRCGRGKETNGNLTVPAELLLGDEVDGVVDAEVDKDVGDGLHGRVQEVRERRAGFRADRAT